MRASEIDFWKEDITFEMMSLKHVTNMYPPRVKMTVVPRSCDRNTVILPIKITGCSDEGRLDMDLTIGDTVMHGLYHDTELIGCRL